MPLGLEEGYFTGRGGTCGRSAFPRQGRYFREVHRMGGAGQVHRMGGLTEVAKGRAGIFRALRPRPAGCGAAANKLIINHLA